MSQTRFLEIQTDYQNYGLKDLNIIEPVLEMAKIFFAVFLDQQMKVKIYLRTHPHKAAKSDGVKIVETREQSLVVLFTVTIKRSRFGFFANIRVNGIEDPNEIAKILEEKNDNFLRKLAKKTTAKRKEKLIMNDEKSKININLEPYREAILRLWENHKKSQSISEVLEMIELVETREKVTPTEVLDLLMENKILWKCRGRQGIGRLELPKKAKPRAKRKDDGKEEKEEGIKQTIDGDSALEMMVAIKKLNDRRRIAEEKQAEINKVQEELDKAFAKIDEMLAKLPTIPELAEILIRETKS
jgi:hypothetical protein